MAKALTTVTLTCASGPQQQLSWPDGCLALDLEGEIRRLYEVPASASVSLALLSDDGQDAQPVVLSPALPGGCKYRVDIACPFPQVSSRLDVGLAQGSAVTSADSMPIVSVTLFKHGAAQVVRARKLSEVQEATALELQLEDMNAVLRTLHVEPQACVQSVTYDSACAPSSQLRESALEPPHSIGELLLQLRGAQVQVTMSGGNKNSRGCTWCVAGRILSVTGNGMHLLTEASGVVPLAVEQIQHFWFPEPAVQAEYARLLAAQVATLEHGKKGLKINIKPRVAQSTDEKLSLSYLVQAAVWKTSYRLLVSRKRRSDGKEEDEELQLTGWAVVDNTSQEDWTDVKLTLVSGQPNRPQCDIYSPVFRDRGGVKEWDLEMRERRKSFGVFGVFPHGNPAQQGTFQNNGFTFQNNGFPGNQGAGLFGQQAAGAGFGQNAGGLGPQNAAGFGAQNAGGTFGAQNAGGTFGGNTGGAAFGANTAAGTFGANAGDAGGGGLFSGSTGGGLFGGSSTGGGGMFGQNTGGGLIGSASAQASSGFGSAEPPTGGAASSMAIPEQAAPVRSNSEASALFSYSIPHSLSVAAKSSATIPIFEGEALVGSVKVVVDSNTVAFPRSAVLFRNSKSLTLEGGPVSVFEQQDSGTPLYVGEAILPFMLPGEQHCLEFGCESRLKVRRFVKQLPDTPVRLRIGAGSKSVSTDKARRRIIGYSLKNTADDQTLNVRVLHHATTEAVKSAFGRRIEAHSPQWRPTMHRHLVERRPPNVWIYELKVEPQSSVLLQVVEACVQTQLQPLPENSSFFAKLAADVPDLPAKAVAKLNEVEQSFKEVETLSLKLQGLRQSIAHKAKRQEQLLEQLRGTETTEQLTSWKTQVGKELETLQREGGLEEQQMQSLMADGQRKEQEARQLVSALSIDFQQAVPDPVSRDPGVPEELPYQLLLQSSAMKSRVFPARLDLSLAPSQLLLIDTQEHTVEQIHEVISADDSFATVGSSDGWEVVPSEMGEGVTDAPAGSLAATVRANVGLKLEELPQEGLWTLVEVTVIAEGSSPDGLVVGLVEESTDISGVGPALGLLQHSVGLASDGSMLVHTSDEQVHALVDSYGWKDSIAVIWDGASGAASFTKNGRPIAKATARLSQGRWFVAVSLRSRGARLRLNFGQQPFCEGISNGAPVPPPPMIRTETAEL